MKIAGYFIGMILFLIGLTSLLLNVTGVRYSFLSFIEQAGALVAFLIRLGMIVGGILILYLSATNWQRERDEVLRGERWDESQRV